MIGMGQGCAADDRRQRGAAGLVEKSCDKIAFADWRLHRQSAKRVQDQPNRDGGKSQSA